MYLCIYVRSLIRMQASEIEMNKAIYIQYYNLVNTHNTCIHYYVYITTYVAILVPINLTSRSYQIKAYIGLQMQIPM